MTTTIFITREIEIIVEARYIPAVRATYLNPGEPAAIEIIEAYDHEGLTIDLTDAEADEAERMFLASPPERDYDED